VHRWPAAWRRRSATLLSTPPLTSTATRSGALSAAAQRVRCSSTKTASSAAPAPGAAAGGAEDESARNGCGGRRERTKGLGTTRDGRQISGRKVEATTCSMGAARVKVSAVASRVSQDWIGFLSCYCPGDGPPRAGLQAEGRGQRGGRAGICGVGGEAGSGRRRRRASSGSSSRSIILRKGKGNMVNLRC
jgi:hypothetical protein